MGDNRQSETQFGLASCPDPEQTLMESFEHLTAEARRRSLVDTLSGAPETSELWLFAYGSLIWRPCFTVQSRLKGVLHGYERRFCVYTVEARGTPELPGLGLGLEPAPRLCQGVLLSIPQRDRDQALTALWVREMLTAVYQPRWLTVETETEPLKALAFVVDPGHRQYAGHLTEETQAGLIRSARGKLGTCREYLASTVDALADAGIDDPYLAGLLARVDG